MKKLAFLVALMFSVTTFAAEYVLVKEKTELQSGDIIILANEANGYVNGPIVDGTSHFSAIEAEFHNDTVSAFGAAEITLDGGPGSCNFVTAQGTVSCAAVGALTTDPVSTGSWNLNFDDYYADGTVEIFWHTSAFANSYMKFSNQLPGFKNYKNGMLEVHIYKKLEPTEPYVSVLSSLDFGQIKLSDASVTNNKPFIVDANNGVTYDFIHGEHFSATGDLSTTGGTLTISFSATAEGVYTDTLFFYDSEYTASTYKVVTLTARVISSTGDGSKENPYTVADIYKAGSKDKSTTWQSGVWVKGYIVGGVVTSGAVGTLKTSGFDKTNIALADTQDETTNILAVKLTSGNDVYTNLNLVDNPQHFTNKQLVYVYGDQKGYCGQYGMQSVTDYYLPGVDATKVTGVSLNKTTAALECGEGASSTSVTLSATVRPTTAANQNVTWFSSADSVATVSAEGVVTAQSAGEARIYVMTEDGEFTASCVVTVTKHISDETKGSKDTPYTCAEAKANQINSVKWVKGFIVGVPCTIGGKIAYRTNDITTENKQQLALADDLDGTNIIPIKIQDNSDIIADLRLDQHPENIGKKIKIRGALTAYFGFPGMQNASEYEWMENIKVTSVSLDQTSIEINVNEMTTLVATILPADADNKHVVWTSNNPTVASVDDEGNVTALTNGNAVITATTVDGSKTATCNVSVTTASGEILMGDVITADTTGVSADSYTIWSDKKCASGTKYAGKSATTNNDIKITSRAATSDSKKETGIVNSSTVGYLRQVVVKWGNQNASGRKVQVLGSNEPITSAADLYANLIAFDTLGVLENTGDYDTVTVSQNYHYVGLLAISSNATYFGKVSFTWAVNQTAEDIELTGIALDKKEVTLEEKNTEKIKVTYTPTNATYKAVTWTSSNTSVATVNGGTITAIAPGQADIIVTSVKYPTVADTCHVTVTKEDIFKGRDIYYKIKSLDELHNHDSVIFVNIASKRVSADFETYESYNKTTQTNITMGRIRTSETEVVVEADSIGSWGAEEVHMVQIEGGKWQILVTVWGEEDEYGISEKSEVPLRATATNKLKLKGEGVQTWTIDFNNEGDAIITSIDSSVGRLQFNSNNKTFTTYTSNQGAVQIYRKKNQTISEDKPKPDPDKPDAIQYVELTDFYGSNGRIYGEGEFQIFTVTGIDVTNENGNLNGVYIVRQGNIATKIVVR